MKMPTDKKSWTGLQRRPVAFANSPMPSLLRAPGRPRVADARRGFALFFAVLTRKFFYFEALRTISPDINSAISPFQAIQAHFRPFETILGHLTCLF